MNQPKPAVVPSILSREAARTALLVAQGIEHSCRQPATKDGVLEYIRTMGHLQIDTINVVARSPYFVLWTRLGDYEPIWLDELLEEGKIYEAWSHEACFLPIEEYPYTRTRVEHPHPWKKRYFDFLKVHRVEADKLIEHVRANGEVRSSDFENMPGASGGWWEWKYEKRLLESLFTEGSLMVTRREKFQRVHNLQERVMPGWDDSQTPSHHAMVRACILHTVKALGVTTAAWIPDYYRFKVGEVGPVLKKLVDAGELLVTSIDGIKGDAYVHPVNSELIAEAVGGLRVAQRTTLLSPFDPVVWDRRRGKELFEFSYLIECYTPVEKRKFGYFSLPILHRGELVGRLDAKAHRKEKVFEVRALHLEPGVAPDEGLATALAGALNECATWHRAPKVVIRKSNPRGFAPLLRAHLIPIKHTHRP